MGTLFKDQIRTTVRYCVLNIILDMQKWPYPLEENKYPPAYLQASKFVAGNLLGDKNRKESSEEEY
jgi:hypothetical protein